MIIFILLTKLVGIGITILCLVFVVDYLSFRQIRFHVYNAVRANVSKRDIKDCESKFRQYSNFDSKVYFLDITRRLELISRLIKGVNGNLLDIGCGEGHSTVSLVGGKRKVIGLDISSSLLYILKKKCSSIMLVAGDAEHIPFKEKSFDVIVMAEVLEHLLNPSDALKECKRLLRKGGVLVITTPTAAGTLPTINPLIWLDQIIGIWHRRIIGAAPTVIKHVSGKLIYHTNFTYKELERLVRDAGFNITYFCSDLPRWVFHVFKWLPLKVFTSLVIMVERLFRQLPLLKYMGQSWIAVVKNTS